MMNRQESIYLPQFTIGEDAFDAFSVEMGRYGNKVVIVHGERAWNASKEYVLPALEKAGLTVTGEILYGHEATYANTQKIAESPEVIDADMVIAVGGGKCIDTVKLAADYVNEKMEGEANVLIMMANLDTSNQLEQKTAFEEKCAAEYPGIKVVLTDEDNGDSATALQRFEDNLKAHPEIDTIFCLESIGGVAAANAVEELGMEGQITILAIDDNEDTLQYIRDGRIWGTMAQNFYKMGYTAGEFASKYLKGETVDSIVDSGTILITEENIDSYTDEFYK